MLTTIIVWIGTISYLLYPVIAIATAIIEGVSHNKSRRKKYHKKRNDNMELIRGDNGEFIWLDMRR